MKTICSYIRKIGLSAILALPLSGATLVISTGAMDAWDLGQVAPPAHLGGYSLVAALAQTASVGTAAGGGVLSSVQGVSGGGPSHGDEHECE